MWARDKSFQPAGFSTPPPTWKSGTANPPPMVPKSERKRISPAARCDLFHVTHKVPAGDSPFVRAKQVQLIDKNPSKAISLFLTAINAGDGVDSALKDMVAVMKQLDRAEEAIEAIRSCRHLCPFESQDSLNNVLVELYKSAGGIEDEIEMLQSKLKRMDEGIAFNGKRTKNARAQGKNVQITVEQERSRVLGNLAWAYMQQGNYTTAEEHYKNALALEADKNKQCNLAVCLMHMNRNTEARHLLQAVRDSSGNKPMDESYAKSFEHALKMLTELETQSILRPIQQNDPRNTGDSRPSFTSKIKENQGGMIGTEVNPHEKIYASPVLYAQFLGNDVSDSDHGTKLFLGNRDTSNISRTSEAPIAICSQGDHLALVTDHSASDVNQSLDLLSAELPKSASEEGRGKGTTTIAVIGEGAIFLATDRRLTSVKHHHIVGNRCKFFMVKATGQPVVATIAGSMGICITMLEYVKRKVKQGISRGIYRSSKSIHTAAFYAMKYISTWELKHIGKTFPARSLLAGWDGEQPCVYKVASIKRGGLEDIEVKDGIFVTGSGGRYAHFYAESSIGLCNTNQFGRLVRNSVLNAAMQDAPTGDQIQSVEVLKNSCITGSPRDVLHILEEQFMDFQAMLENALFFVHARADLPYTHVSNNIVNEEIMARLGAGLTLVPHVVSLKGEFVVRIAMLNEGSHKAFEALTAGTILRWVTPSHEWPCLYFNRVPRVPIFFARATIEIITMLGKL